MLRFVSEQTETQAPAADADLAPIDAAIKARREEWAKESKSSKPQPPAVSAPDTTATVTDTANVGGGAQVSDGKATAKDTQAKAAPKTAPTSDLSWLPEEFHSPQSRQSEKFLTWMKANTHREAKFTKEMQEIAEERKQIAGFKEDAETWRLLKKNPEAADIAYRLVRGESLEDIIASRAGSKEQPGGFDDPDINVKVKTLAKSVFDETRAQEKAEADMSAAQRASVQRILVSHIKDNAIDPDLGLAAIESASAALAEDGLTWTVQNAERVLKRHLALAKASAGNGASGSNGRASDDSLGLSKVASPTGNGVGTRALPAALSAEVRKRWASGQVSDEERLRIFNRLPASRRGQDEPTASED